jgi:hypothetical protein
MPTCHSERNAVKLKNLTNGVNYRPMGSFGYAQDDRKNGVRYRPMGSFGYAQDDRKNGVRYGPMGSFGYAQDDREKRRSR